MREGRPVILLRWAAVLALFWATGIVAQTATTPLSSWPSPLILEQAPHEVQLRSSMVMVRDDTGSMGPAEAFEAARSGRTVPLAVEGVPYRSPSPHWGLVRVIAGAAESNWIAYYRLGTIEDVQVHMRIGAGAWLPLPGLHEEASLLGGYHYPSFALHLPPGELVDIAVRVRTRAPLRMAVHLVPGYHYYQSQRRELVVAGLTFAVPLVVLLYLVLLLPAARRTGIGWFIGLITLETVGAMWVSGHGHVLFPQIPRETWPSIGRLAYTAMVIAGWKHATVFLRDARWPRWVRIGGWGLVWVIATLAALELLQIANTRTLYTLCILLFPLAITAISLDAWRQGVRSAALYALSWSAFVVAGGAAAFGLFGVAGTVSWSVFYAQSSVVALLFGLVAVAQVRERERELEFERRERIDLKESLQLRLNFFAATNHDLRQPLQSLGLYADMAEREVSELKLAGPLAGYLGKIKQAYRSVSQFIDALIDLSRLDAQVLSPEMGEVNIGALVLRLSQEYQPLAGQSGLELRHVPKAAFAQTDAVLLERVLRNLLGNAVRYTRSGGILVGVRRRERVWRIDVVDTGPGIDVAAHRRAFGEFAARRTGADMGHISGEGLGLAIVARLCEALGHKFEVASVPGRGTRVSISLGAASASGHAVPALNTGTSPLRGLRVLVLEDEPEVLQAFADMLRRAGAEVVACESAAQVTLADTKALAGIDVWISDFRMADGTLSDHIGELRRLLPPRTPLIVVSGSMERDVARRIAECGAAAHHAKPVDAATLLTSIQTVLGRRN